MKPENLSYCGVDCRTCNVFKATVHGDEAARAEAVKIWVKTAQQHWGMETLDPAILNCRGCRIEGPAIFKGCSLCPIRRCAKGRNLSSCGLCPEWRDCERLSEPFESEPQARENLERMAEGSNQPEAGDAR